MSRLCAKGGTPITAHVTAVDPVVSDFWALAVGLGMIRQCQRSSCGPATCCGDYDGAGEEDAGH